MNRIKLLSRAFNRLSDIEVNCINIWQYESVYFYMKRLFVLASIFYPKDISQMASDCYYVGEFGEIWSGKFQVEEEDVYGQFTATQSDAVRYLLVYYQKSPYWEVHFECLSMDESEKEKEMSLLEFFEGRSLVFENKLISSLQKSEGGHPLKAYYNLFEKDDDCVADDCIILRSKLIPYYKRIEDRIAEEDSELCQLINRCEVSLTRWLNGCSFSINSILYENAYYISTDNSACWCDSGFGAGVLEHKLNILVAGEIIDLCILELDEKYSFLPEHIKNMDDSEKGENT